ncbi:MAG TPA: ABC transporter ATP-binding protein [Caldisericia bacterium]|nr:ABC transporter ATP-binding protein [Caldisericia bacterium]HPF49009.1 ABC transporter ATP-binding protein [Caldisericia bacterium]HPI83127.1 ABC transporter ATP-binding protein [Caldisericia bacterium]HRV74548.1 ABC transporter ATP-binding protein [Caldisericia bacterium]
MRFDRNIVFGDVSCDFTQRLSIICGANGSGKTTLMKILSGLVNPTSGKITYTPGIANIRIGFDSPYIHLYPDLTVREIMDFFSRLKRIEKYDLREWELHKIRHKKYKNLSSGFKQRVKLAQAFLGNPDLLLLDEPEQHLDEGGKNLLKEKLSQREKMIIVSTNNPESEQKIVLWL